MGKTFQIFGHEKVKNILEKSLSAGIFSHAYLFVGPIGVGKKALAVEFAQKILETQNLAGHPDFLLLDEEGEITMEPTLAFIDRLSLKPFYSKYKVAVINNAENFNQQSGNAFLKTLEEPAKNTIIILVAGYGQLLPTIVSRCQTLHFNSFTPEQLLDFSRQSGINASPEIVGLSFGSFGRLKKLTEDKNFLASEQDAIDRYKKLVLAGRGEKFSEISNYSELEEEKLAGIFRSWMFWQYQQLKQSPKNFSKVRAIADALSDLQRNFNKKLVIQNLFLKI